VANPLIAPFQSPDVVVQMPSTQLSACVTTSVTVCGGKFEDSTVPVHVPAMLMDGSGGASGGGGGGGVVGVVGAAPHPSDSRNRRSTTMPLVPDMI